ncbi:hypothetical protein ASD40_23230 [Paenibacillus sp. Root444D2]|nr:hypothetical protein ASD40_23230 [Paenibacillus sp. Root444D2]KRE32448.1 hypothetical protein ASG85_17380 [Paenibacillus sp. Soil724D2]
MIGSSFELSDRKACIESMVILLKQNMIKKQKGEPLRTKMDMHLAFVFTYHVNINCVQLHAQVMYKKKSTAGALGRPDCA